VTFYRHLFPELARLGHKVHALVGSAVSPMFQNYSANGIDVEFLDLDIIKANVNKFDAFAAVPELQWHLAAAWAGYEQAEGGAGYDLVETTDWGLLFVPWIINAKSPPIVVQLHGSIGQIDFNDPQVGNELYGDHVRLLEVGLLSHAEELQSGSMSNAQLWEKLTGRGVTYIPPAWSPLNVARTCSSKSSRGLIVGRIQYWKGPYRTLRGTSTFGE